MIMNVYVHCYTHCFFFFLKFTQPGNESKALDYDDIQTNTLLVSRRRNAAQIASGNNYVGNIVGGQRHGADDANKKE